MDANAKQVGGQHYKKYGDIQPWDVVTAWGLGYLDGTALKYIARWRDKNGLEDIQKAIHFLEKLIEVEKVKQDDRKLQTVRSNYTGDGTLPGGWEGNVSVAGLHGAGTDRGSRGVLREGEKIDPRR